MKIALLTGLMALGVVITHPTQAEPSKAASPAISQIVITRYTGSDASHPKADYIYRILLKRDGTAIYVGNKTYMKRIGRYRGTISQSDFARLATLFQKRNLRGSYNVFNGRQVAEEIFKVTSGKHQQKIIVLYEQSGPQALRQASKIAYGLLWKVRWNKVSSSDAISG